MTRIGHARHYRARFGRSPGTDKPLAGNQELERESDPACCPSAAILGLYLSGAMLIPALVDLYYGHADWQVFAVTAFMTGAISSTTFMATRAGPPPFSKKFGFLVVNVLWIVFSMSAPFHLAFLGESGFRPGLFESVSAVTTTGSTVIVGLDDAPGLLLWRSLLSWFGGIGIVVLGPVYHSLSACRGNVLLQDGNPPTPATNPLPGSQASAAPSSSCNVSITLLCAICYAHARE